MPTREPPVTLRAALAYFTRLPLGSRALASCRGVNRWLPVVGLILGGLLAPVVWLTAMLLPGALCGVVSCIALIALTGGLHLDGVADSGDGLLASATPERRLDIMKDARVGTFGVLALVSVVLLKAAALHALGMAVAQGRLDLVHLLGRCCLATTLARCATFLAFRLPSAHPGGLGATGDLGVTARHRWAALALALALCALNGLHGLWALVMALCTACLLLSLARRRLGGITGDVYGALIELVETMVLITCCL